VVRLPTLAPGRWEPCLQGLKALGFDTLDLPLVWRDHAREDGTFTLDQGALDLPAMLRAAARSGLRVLVRLGPFALPQGPAGGIPEAVLTDPRCQRRSDRGRPTLLFHAGTLLPRPDPASEVYRMAVCGWVCAVVRQLAPAAREGLVAGVVVGHGPDPALSPDPGDDGMARALWDAAREEGLPEEALLVPGDLLAPREDRPGVYAAPPPHAGTTALWRALRGALARSAGLHLDLRAGGSVFERPTLSAHTEEVARLALAAGVRSYSVFMGCAGSGWVGALLDEEGAARRTAWHWRALNALAASLPAGEELTARVPPLEGPGLPVPFGGLLAWAGLAEAEPVAWRRRRGVEEALTRAGLPWTPSSGAWTATEAALAALAPEVRPEGAALVRIVRDARGLHLVAVNRTDATVTVEPGAKAPWRSLEAGPEGTLTLAPGAVGVLTLPAEEAPW
jgi:hypothetical protein